MRRVSRWLALDRRSGRGAGLPTVEVVAAEDYDRVLREVNDLRDQVQMYEEKAERDWRDFGEMQDARIAADDRVVELEKELARVCKQLDSANDMVERDGETPQNRRDLEAREDWRAARVDAINRGDLSFDRGFISGLTAGRAVASPDERLREAARVLVERSAAAVCQPGQFRDNVGEAQWRLSDAITATRAALAADREAPVDPKETTT